MPAGDCSAGSVDGSGLAGKTAAAAMDRRMARRLMERLNRDAERIARRFNLRYQAIEAERANVKRRYGVCYSDGGIKIRLRHAVTGHALKYSSLVNTLCHELAHLRYFNHGERFKVFYQQLLEYARAEGIYRPGAIPRQRAPQPRPRPIPALEAPRRARTQGEAAEALPVQLTLFS